MTRPLTNSFTFFLDQFSERLEVDCELLKRQLAAQVDQQFGFLRTKVSELRVRFGGDRGNRNTLLYGHLDDPPVETVSLDKWIEQRGATAEEESFSTPSTSTGLKRKSTAKQSQSTNKRQKSGGSTANAGRNKLVCKYAGCGKSFSNDYDLARHERIHLGIKPFSCTWLDCRYSAVRKANVVEHVRMQHFKLPKLQKEQTRLNIVDDRNPQDYIRVDNQLLKRRLK